MESKKGIKDRTSRSSEKEKVKADLRSEATKFDNEGKEKTGRVTSGGRAATYNRNKSRDGAGDSSDLLSSLRSNKGTILGVAGAIAGGALLFRSFKKGKTSSKKSNEVILHTKQTINRSREELYAYWRNLENLPNFMSHIKEVEELDEKRSRWTAKIPGGMGTIDWEADIEEDIPNSYISWRSIADADIENAGEVRFKAAPAGRGTIVETTISYRPPAGNVGETLAELLNPAFENIVKKDLKQFKEHMEEGGEERNQLFL